MYGTIARLRVKAGAEGKIESFLANQQTHVSGFVTEYVYRSDDDANTLWLAVVFDSKESYVANAQSPHQNVQYRSLRSLLESDPEWHDGKVIFSVAVPA